MLGHTSITNYYYLMFNMAQHHGYGIEDLENILPYELDLYTTMLLEYLEKQKELAKARN
jgi:hypothetical protein